MEPDKPVIFLAFANEHEPGRHLRNLNKERREVEKALCESGAFHVVVRDSATLEDIVAVFQRHRDRVALFHYGGHAESYGVLLHSPTGETALVGTDLAGFLGRQRGLRFVFLNACSTGQFVEALVEAGVPAVAGTSLNVDDEVATDFAVTFYRGLAAETAVAEGVSLERAFAEAESVAKAGLAQAARAPGLEDSGNRSVAEPSVVVAYRRAEVIPVPEEPDVHPHEWPWSLRVAAEDAREWCLREAIADPLFGLPDLPQAVPVPAEPFRYLHWFEREHSRVFFGRGKDIARGYHWAIDDTPPVLLLYGQSGVGKSSFLEAGLLPRLETDHEVRYLRRDPEQGLLATLAAGLECAPDAREIADAWRRTEAEADRPVLVALDQVEEAYTQPLDETGDEIGDFFRGLRNLFGRSADRPDGRLILGFRKEWLAELEAQADDSRLNWSKMFLRRLDREGIVEAIRGVTSDPELSRRYGLTVDEWLPEKIAEDLLDDADASVAPTLQVLLTKMWEEASKGPEPEFSIDLYRRLKRGGLLLSDFLDEQLDRVREECSDWVDLGLAIDVLAYHTTRHGTGKRRSLKKVSAKYAHLPDELPPLLEALLRHHLLAADEERGGALSGDGYRLAHDNLAPLVRSRFDASTKPGQRLRRALEPRATEWERHQGALFGEAELAGAERAAAGMRAMSDIEKRFIEASLEAVRLEKRQRRDARFARGFAFVLVAVLALYSFVQRGRSVGFEAQAKAGELAALAENRLDRGDVIASSALGFSALGQARTDEVERAAYDVLGSPMRPVSVFRFGAGAGREAIARAVFARSGSVLITTGADSTARIWSAETGNLLQELNGHAGPVTFGAFSPDGQRVVTGGEDGTARIWSTRNGTPLVDTVVKHQGAVSLVAFSPDGERVASLSEVGPPKLWRLDSQGMFTEIADLEGHVGAVLHASFSPNGQHLITSGSDKTARVWSALTGENALVLSDHGLSVVHAEFSRDGGRIVTASQDGVARIWSTADGALLLTLDQHEASLAYATFSPDGSKLTTASDDATARLWHLAPILGELDSRSSPDSSSEGTEQTTARGKEAFVGSSGSAWIVSVPENDSTSGEIVSVAGVDTIAGPISHPRGRIVDVALSPDGERIVTAGTDATIRVWSVGTEGELAVSPTVEPGVSIVSFRGDGSEIVTIDSIGRERFWAPGGAPRSTSLSGLGSAVARVGFTPDGREITMLTRDGTARTWSTASRSVVAVLRVAEDNRWTSFSPDGRRVVTVGATGVVRTWGVEVEISAAVLEGHRSPVVDFDFRERGRLAPLRRVSNAGCSTTGGPQAAIVTVDGSGALRGWSLSGDPAVIWNERAPNGAVLALGPGGRVLATSSGSGETRIGCIGGSETPERVLRGPRPDGPAVFDPDGSRLYAATADGAIGVWGLDGASLGIYEGPRQAPTSLAVSDDGTRLIAGMNAGAWYWNISSREARELVGVGSSAVRSVAITNDGSLAATGDARGQVTLWTTDDGNAVRRLGGHEGPVLTMLFDPDGHRLVTGGADGTVRIWSVDSGDDIAVLEGHEAGVLKLRLGDEGRRLASASEDGTVRVWGFGAEALRELVRDRLPRGLSRSDLPLRLPEADVEELLGGGGRR